MKFGVALGALNPRLHEEATLLAEQLGFESAWLPEHLVFISGGGPWVSMSLVSVAPPIGEVDPVT